MTAIANGGTLYYLQYPRTQQEIQNFVPRIKRKLDIGSMLPDIRDGMLAAVLYGTAHRSYEGEGEQPLGKTGTCSDSASRVGWFVSYADQVHPKIVLAVLIRGYSHTINGPFAAGIAGQIYKRLDAANYFAEKPRPLTPAASVPVASPTFSAGLGTGSGN